MGRIADERRRAVRSAGRRLDDGPVRPEGCSDGRVDALSRRFTDHCFRRRREHALLWPGRHWIRRRNLLRCAVVVPSYVGEIATPTTRGTLGFIFQLMMSLGVLVSSAKGVFGLDWRWFSGTAAAAPLVAFFAVFFIPESPYHLLKRGVCGNNLKIFHSKI